MKLTSRKQFAQAQLELMQRRPVAAETPPSLYQLARACLADVQGAVDYASPGPRMNEEQARRLLERVFDRIGLSGVAR